MMMSRLLWSIAVSAIFIVAVPLTADPAAPQLAETADDVIFLRNVAVKNGEVSGELVNNSPHTVRDVELQILYSWRWKDEFRPGKDDPGRAEYVTLDKEIPPGKSMPLKYKPSPPLPARSDGDFDISVKVVEFTRIIPQN
jgi:hypothetical protein